MNRWPIHGRGNISLFVEGRRFKIQSRFCLICLWENISFPLKKSKCKTSIAYFMVVVGTNFTFLLVVVKWLKSNHLTAYIYSFLLPFQRQPRLRLLNPLVKVVERASVVEWHPFSPFFWWLPRLPKKRVPFFPGSLSN